MTEDIQSRHFQIFIAYHTGTGIDIALHLKQILEDRKIHAFVAQEDIPKAIRYLSDDWMSQIDAAIQACNIFIIILSATELSKEMVREVRLAVDRKRTDNKLCLFICRYERIPRSSKDILLAVGLDTSAFQQTTFKDQVDLARNLNLEIDDQGFARKDELFTGTRRGFESQPTEELSEADTTPEIKSRGSSFRLSMILLNPIFFLPIIFTLALGCLSPYIYPFDRTTMASFWFGLSERILLILGFIWIPAAGVCIFTKVSLSRSADIPRVSLRSLFASMWKRVSRNRTLLKGALLLVLFAVFVTMTDSGFGVLSPRVNYVVTQYASGYFVVEDSASQYHVLVHVRKTYSISSPMYWFVGDLVIPNPSNYSYTKPSYPSNSPCYDDFGAYTPGSGITACVADTRVHLLSVTNETGSVGAFRVILTPSPQPYTVVLSAEYDDYILANPIVVLRGTPLLTGNTFYLVINVTLSNPLSEDLSIPQLYLGQFGHILNVTCSSNNVARECINNSTQQLWLWPYDLNPGQTMHFTIRVTYLTGNG